MIGEAADYTQWLQTKEVEGFALIGSLVARYKPPPRAQHSSRLSKKRDPKARDRFRAAVLKAYGGTHKCAQLLTLSVNAILSPLDGRPGGRRYSPLGLIWFSSLHCRRGRVVILRPIYFGGHGIPSRCHLYFTWSTICPRTCVYFHQDSGDLHLRTRSHPEKKVAQVDMCAAAPLAGAHALRT